MYDPKQIEELEGTEVAIIGMSCRFPGARNPREFWDNLRAGVESIAFFDEDRHEPDPFVPHLAESPDYVRAAPVLDDITSFDAAFFGYSPREAEVMDPQQRLFLESAWHALEHAGYAQAEYDAPVGVFAGARTNTYLLGLATRPELLHSVGAFEIGLGNDLAFLSARVAHKLNLRGPAYSVHTACSTGLVTVHLACQSLLLGECRMALAGAVALNIPQNAGYLHTRGGILSPDGHCRAFDVQAGGTVFGSGLGIVVLKRLEDAMRDGDSIRAVIRGSAANNDGSEKASFTAPAVHGQSEVILEALAAADAAPESIGYVETHGTGTALGDSIEIRALAHAFQMGSERAGTCPLGSVKTNFGHLDAAAGMASLIKTVLALEHGELPPTLHFTEPDPKLDLANTPFYVNDRLRPWDGPLPRRAGVSSFGVGGTNVHLVLEQAPARRARRPSGQDRTFLLPLAAKSESALDALTESLCKELAEASPGHLEDLAFTLQEGRVPFAFRRVAIGRDPAELIRALRENDPGHLCRGRMEIRNRPVVLMFPGNGVQHARMGRMLYRGQPVFREAVDACRRTLAELSEPDPLPIIDGDIHEAEALLAQPGPAMTALFSVEYALARLWMEYGVKPRAMIGHSLGEYVAACLAGVFSLRDALFLVAERGRLVAELPRGAMVSVRLSPERLTPYLTEDLSISAINASERTVAAGPQSQVDLLTQKLTEDGVEVQQLHVQVAFHSPLIDAILPKFRDRIRGLRFYPPKLPFISCLRGTWAEDGDVTDPEYWVSHLRQPVRFHDGLLALLEGPRTLIEAGPGSTLGGLAQDLIGEEVHQVLTSLPHPRERADDALRFAKAFAALWCGGADVAWRHWRGQGPVGRVPAPLYPFQRKVFWVEPKPSGRDEGSGLWLGKQAQVHKWFFEPEWRRSEPLPAVDLPASTTWLVFTDSNGPGESFAKRLGDRGHQVVTVSPGRGFEEGSGGRFRIDPRQKDDYFRLFSALAEAKCLPSAVAHFWSVTGGRETSFEALQYLGYYSALFLAKALDEYCADRPVRLRFFTDETLALTECEPLEPGKTTLIGPVKVLPQEHERLSCSLIDVNGIPAGHRLEEVRIEQWIRECLHDGPYTLLAYRGMQRWEQRLRPAPLGRDRAPRRELRQNGVYWITGGLGGVGYLIGAYLAERFQARLVLTGRSELPPRDRWTHVSESLVEGDPVLEKIKRIRDLEALGGKVLALTADTADEPAMTRVLERIDLEYGELHGVLHAAGVTQGDSLYRPAVEIGVTESETQFRPKVLGVGVLEKILGGRHLDFLLLFSSNSAVLGGLGYVAYAAANAYMDAFAVDRGRVSRFPWISVDWDPWPEETKHYDSVATAMDDYAMTVDECREAFELAATMGPEGQLVVATGDLAARYEQWISALADPDPKQAEKHERPSLDTAFADPRNETEETLVGIWQDILGIDKVGVHDNFFDLGGHSLLATRLATRISKTFTIRFSLTDFFESPTVGALADMVSSQQRQEAETDEREVLQMLAGLSEEEAAAELERLSE